MDGVGSSNVKVVETPKKLGMMTRSSDIMLRILGFSLTLIAAIVVGVDKETKMVSISTFIKNLPPVQVSVTAKWKYMSAFVTEEHGLMVLGMSIIFCVSKIGIHLLWVIKLGYFLVSNTIACSYAAVSLAFCLAIRRFRYQASLILILFDLIMMGLLFSANGAAMGVGMIGLKGNSHVPWIKVCNVFDGFCRQFAAALVLSLVGCLVFLLLLSIAIFNLHRRSR